VETGRTTKLAPGVWALAAVKLALHLIYNRGYGYFRDEFNYLACAEHLDWGYVDHPPLVALVAWVSRAVGGDSLSSIRFLPAVAGAAMVLLAGLIARELGGGRIAQSLAALATLSATMYFVLGNFLSMNAFEPVFWMGCVWVLLRIKHTGNMRLWLWFGVLAGLGLQNKHSMLFFGAAVVAGLSFTRDRALLATRWLWMAGALALLIFLPNIIWQARHGWATFELLSNVAQSNKNVVLSPVAFLAQQVLVMNPLAAPLWIGGLVWLFFHREGGRYRTLGWIFVLVAAAFIMMRGKIYYLAPAFPMLFAAGSVGLETFALRTHRAWLATVLAVLLAVSGAVLAPIGLPVMPPGAFLRYMDWLGIPLPRTETSHTAALPQHYADQFGWEEMAVAVAHIYHSLPAEERAKTAIFGNNYGEAGAIDFFGPRLGLPKAIGAHQTYFFWGPRDYTGEIVIVLGGRRRDLEARFESVTEAAVLNHPYAIPFENRPIFLCRGLKTPLPELWPRLKNWL
jgi:4-amino-4-deoxy-L-arabinose transferase-like glycosyltransferase